MNPMVLNHNLNKAVKILVKDENKYGNIVGVLKNKTDKDCHHNQSIIS